jgi:hypothetical protein
VAVEEGPIGAISAHEFVEECERQHDVGPGQRPQVQVGRAGQRRPPGIDHGHEGPGALGRAHVRHEVDAGRRRVHPP